MATRFIPADAVTVSRLLAKAGIGRRRGVLGGFTARSNEVSIRCPYNEARETEDIARAVKVLEDAGYLIERSSERCRLYLFRPVKTDSHADLFIAKPFLCKVVTDDGTVIPAIEDPQVQAEVKECEQRLQEQQREAEARQDAAKRRQQAVLARLKSLRVTARADWRYEEMVTVSVIDLEKFLDAVTGDPSGPVVLPTRKEIR